MADILETIQSRGIEALGRFYSSYRALVLSNEDPDKEGKILIQIPSVHNIIGWAYPKVLCGGPNTGFKYLIPPKNSIVYVEFENGDPAHPLWSYHGWAVGEIPPELEDIDTLGIVTPNGNKIYLSEKEGILHILTKGGTSIKTVNSDSDKEKFEVTVDINTNGVQIHSEKDVKVKCDGVIEVNGGNNRGLVNISQIESLVEALFKDLLIAQSGNNLSTWMAKEMPKMEDKKFKH